MFSMFACSVLARMAKRGDKIRGGVEFSRGREFENCQDKSEKKRDGDVQECG